jgi:phage terminase large subunit-like protein
LTQDPLTWSTACPDWADRLKARQSLVPPLPLHAASAAKGLRVFKRLRVPDLPDHPTFGEVCGPWVFDLVAAIFGSYDPETRVRALQEFFLLVPKKNGKSTIAAGIIVTAAILNDRPENELILIAPTQTIAGIAFKTCRGIIRLDPELGGPDGLGKEGGIFEVRGHRKEIEHRGTGALIRVLSADGDVVTGSKAAFILVDETHVLGAKEKAAEVFLELRGGLASRPEGFLLQITTQSKARPSGQFAVELEAARAVRDGRLDYPLLPVLYELPRDMAEAEAWRDPATWGLVNPGLGQSLRVDYLEREFEKASEEGIEALARFASQHLNVEIGLGLRSGRWPAADHWLAASEPGLDLVRLLETSEVVVGGVDGGGLDDLLAFGLMGRRPDGVWQWWCRAWADRGVLELRKSIAPELQALEATGDLVLVNDLEDAHREIAEICRDVFDRGLLPASGGLGFDRAGVTAIYDALEAEGLDLAHAVGVPQGQRLKGAIQGAPPRLKARRLVHGGQRLMTWAVENVRLKARETSVQVDKAQAGSAKIDPVIAFLNAFTLMSAHPVPARQDLGAFLAQPVMVA